MDRGENALLKMLQREIQDRTVLDHFRSSREGMPMTRLCRETPRRGTLNATHRLC